MPIEFPAGKKELIEALLDQPVLARLATSNGKTGQPHVVPVWFLWDGVSLWISAFSSTRKVRDLLSNPKCALLIEPKEPAGLEAVLFEGDADVIDQPRHLVCDMSVRIYARYMGKEGAQAPEPQSWAIDRENRLIRLTTRNIYTW